MPKRLPHRCHAMVDLNHEQRAYISIPKNASTSTIEALRNQGWRPKYLPDPWLDIKEMIIVLRDPMERWVSGMAQYVQGAILSPVGVNGPVFDRNQATVHDYCMQMPQFKQQYNDVVERLIFDQCDRLDDHVWPQYDFIPDLPTAQRRYIIMDQDFASKINDILQINVQHLNNSDENYFSKRLQHWFRQRLLLRPELEQRIRERYQRDYDLIKQAHGH